MSISMCDQCSECKRDFKSAQVTVNFFFLNEVFTICKFSVGLICPQLQMNRDSMDIMLEKIPRLARCFLKVLGLRSSSVVILC